MVPSASANGSGSDAYAYPDTRRSDANPVSDAVADANFGTDYARRGVYSNRPSARWNVGFQFKRSSSLGLDWKDRRGNCRFTKFSVPTFRTQEDGAVT